MLNKSEYDAAYGADGNVTLSSPLPRALRRLYCSYSFLFIGCSLVADRTLQTFMRVAGEEADCLPHHYALLEAPDDGETQDKLDAVIAQAHISPIWFPAGEFDLIDKIDVAWVSIDDLKAEGLAPQQTTGDTPIVALQDRHVDLQQLDYVEAILMPKASRWLRLILGVLLAFVGVNAVGGGIYGMVGADGVPVAWLEGSPFQSYFIPSLFLCFGVGGVCFASAWAMFARASRSRLWALLAASVLIAWIVAQVLIIGFVSWLQPAVAGTALLIMALAWRLPCTSTATSLIPE